MAQHVHVHLHRTADAGTSEGARKAAQTRKSQGGGIIGGNKSDNTGGSGHYHVNVYHPAGHAEFYPTDATSHGHAKQLAAKNLPGYRIAGSQRVGDAGTSEGARKAAQTRKAHGGSHPAISPDMKDMTAHRWKPAMVQHYNRHQPHTSTEGGAEISRMGSHKGPVFAVEHQGKYYVSGKHYPIPSNPDAKVQTPTERGRAKWGK